MPVSPSVSVNKVDGGLTVVNSSVAKMALLGLARSGAGTLKQTADPKVIKDTFVGGELVEAAVEILQLRKEPVELLVYAIDPSNDGSFGTPKETRYESTPSTGTFNIKAGSLPLDDFDFVIEHTATTADVANGDGEFKYSEDGGDTWSARTAIPTNGEFVVPNSGVTFEFASDFDTGDQFEVQCNGPSFSTSDLTTAFSDLHDEVDDYEVCGVLGDGGSVAANALLFSTLKTTMAARATAKYWALGLSGASFNWKVTPSTSPAATATVVVDAGKPDGTTRIIECTTLGALGTAVFKWSEDGGTTYTENVTTAANGKHNLNGVAITISGSMALGETHTIAAETENDMRLGFDAQTSINAGVATYDVERTALLDGKVRRRNLLVQALIKCTNPLHVDPGKVEDGSLEGVTHIYKADGTKVTRMDAVSSLDEHRFITPYTLARTSGIFIANGNVKCPDGSDFDQIQLVRVINRVCRIVDDFLSKFPGKNLRTQTAVIEGQSVQVIHDADAEILDQQLNQLLYGGIQAPGHVQTFFAKIDRTYPLGSTRKVRANVGLVPFTYVKVAEGNVGFVRSVEQQLAA